MRYWSLAYPLRPATLTAALLFFCVGFILYGSALFSLALGIVASVLWIALACTSTALCLYLLFEYSLDILEQSVYDNRNPPVLRGNLVSLGLNSLLHIGDRRFLKQVLWLATFATLGYRLSLTSLPAIGYAFWAWGLLTLPASLLINAVYNSLSAMFNPVTVLQRVWNCGFGYLLCLLLLGATGVTLLLVYMEGFTGFFLFVPLFLYLHFLHMHLLGSLVRGNYAAFMPVVDFDADKRALQEKSAGMAAYNRHFSEVYELLRKGREEDARQLIDAWLARTPQQDHAQVYDMLAQWPYPGIVLFYTAKNLQGQLEAKHYMRALQLAASCLGLQQDFSLQDYAQIEQLAAQAAGRRQQEIVLSLLENFLGGHTGDAEYREALQLARRIAGSELKDEVRFRALDRFASKGGR